MNILDKIVANKKKELTELVRKIPVKRLEKYDFFSREVIPLSAFILNPFRTGIIAEFKRKSPSAGIINLRAGIEEVTTGYSRLGASGLSVLTEKMFFSGDNNDLTVARKFNSIPILRKDFIIDEYQVIESKAIGADAILLIASLLTKNQIKKLSCLARSLGLQIVLEIHNAGEIIKMNKYIDIAGVNNRDLRTFKVDTELSFRLADRIPPGFVKISESGISSNDIVINLKEAGYQGFLIGGKFMKNSNPVTAFAEFIKSLKGDYVEN
jgi:indole-3-glycerol phosphate synthase